MSIPLEGFFVQLFQSEECSVFIDEAWAKSQSSKYKNLLRQSSHKKNYFELEAKELTEEGVLSVLAQYQVILDGQSGYRKATDWLENKVSGVMVFHNSHLLAGSVLHLISRIIRYTQRQNLAWNFVFIGQTKKIDISSVDQLFVDNFYPSKKTNQVPAKISVAIVAILFCLAVLAVVLLVKPDQGERLNSAVTKKSSPEPAAVAIVRSGAGKAKSASVVEESASSAELHELIRQSEQRDLEFKGVFSETDSQEDIVDEVESIDKVQIIEPSSVQTLVVKSAVQQLSKEAEEAIRNNDLIAVQQVLVSDGLRSSENERGETPLIISVNNNNQQVFEWLLTEKVPVNSMDHYGRTALFYAAINGDDVLLDRLLESGARANTGSNLAKTPLMAAVNNNHLSTAQLLVKHTSNIDAVDHSGWSALFYAVWNSNRSMVELLLEHGASTNLIDNSGLSLKEIAEAKGQVELVDLF